MPSTRGQINFRLRGIISLVIGLIILVVGVGAFYGELIGTTLLLAIMGFSFAFFFVGSILLKWHLANRKRERQKP